MVVAVIALLVALGGTSYAIQALPQNSVGSKQLKNNAVTSKKIKNGAVNSNKVKNGSLLSADFKAGQLPAGPQGPAWPQGERGLQGAQGPQGERGLQGERGRRASGHCRVQRGRRAHRGRQGRPPVRLVARLPATTRIPRFRRRGAGQPLPASGSYSTGRWGAGSTAEEAYPLSPIQPAVGSTTSPFPAPCSISLTSFRWPRSSAAQARSRSQVSAERYKS
jgi:hypothetical protein